MTALSIAQDPTEVDLEVQDLEGVVNITGGDMKILVLITA